ncbi:hypothetical protein Tco_1184967 [Tanacetum coccineum]
MHHHTCNLLPHDQVRLPDHKAKRDRQTMLLHNLSPFSEEDMIQNKHEGERYEKELGTLSKILQEAVQTYQQQPSNVFQTPVTKRREDTTPMYKQRHSQAFVVNQKHDELVKKSLLTRSQFEGQLKEKSKVISDLKVKEGKDIDTMIEMDKQIKFLNEILYKRNQSIQTIHMLAPKCATYNGRSTFANPKYLKIAQSEKPRLYEIPYDTSDPANRFCPNGEETVTLEKESRSKLDKDKVKPYDYTYQNSLYETFKPPSKTYLDQLERAKEVRKTMWRKTFIDNSSNHFCSILGYGDLIQGNVTIKGLLIERPQITIFSRGQFCGCDFVGLHSGNHFVFVSRDFGNQLQTGNHGSDLYTISSSRNNFLTSNLFSRLKLHHSSIDIGIEAFSSETSIHHLLSKKRSCRRISCLQQENTLIVDRLISKFDEIKEMMSDHNSSDLAPQRQEMSVENVSSGLVPQGQKASDYDNSDPVPPRQNVVPSAEKTDSSHQGLEFLFSPLLEEYYNPTHDQALGKQKMISTEFIASRTEFINPFCTRVQEIGESSSRNIDNTDVHSFQPQSHDYRWTRDHPLEQVRGNPTMPVQTRRQLATDPEMCMFALTVSIVEPKNIKEAMADSAWIEAMQDEIIFRHTKNSGN